MPDDDPDDDYVPTDVDANIPKNPAARRAWAAEMEARDVRRDVLLGQIARARAAIYAAEQSGDAARAAELREALAALVAERDAL
jgi:hypothetical protein